MEYIAEYPLDIMAISGAVFRAPSSSKSFVMALLPRAGII
jgi:hypothetical protein